MLTDLDVAVARSGLPVVLEPGWRERGRGPMGRPRAVILHHTATPASAPGDYPSLRVVRDGRAGLAGPLSHLGLGRSGAVYVIAAGKANHAGTGKWRNVTGSAELIGIEAESPGDGSWTDAQRDAYPRLAAALARHYRIDVRDVIGHREWATPPGRKPDPTGIDLPAFRLHVQHLLDAPATEDEHMTPEQYQTLKDVQALLNAYGPVLGHLQSQLEQVRLGVNGTERKTDTVLRILNDLQTEDPTP